METVKLMILETERTAYKKAGNDLSFGKVGFVTERDSLWAIIEGESYGEICRICNLAGYFKGSEKTRDIYKPTK